jgi:hypothetical protein
MSEHEKIVLKRMARNVMKEAKNRGIPALDLWKQISSQLVKRSSFQVLFKKTKKINRGHMLDI